MMSRLLDDVTTLISLQADVASSFRCCDINVQSIVHLMSRLLFCVTTSLSTVLGLILSRPQSDVATSCLFSSSIHGCLTWSFCRIQLVFPSITLLLQLEFYGRDLDMNFHCSQGFMTSGPLILVRLSSCNLLHPVISIMLSHLLLLLLQKFLFLFNSLLHSSLVSYSIFMHINQYF